MEFIKNVLIVAAIFTIVSMVVVKVASYFNERRLKIRLANVLPELIEKEQYDMVVIEVNRAFVNGLSQESKNKIMWYTDLIMSMRIDYSKEKYVSVIKKS